jgi:hypothetical protein
MNVMDLLVKYAPYYLPLLAALVIILFTRDHLYKGMMSIEVYKEQVERERQIVSAQKDNNSSLAEIVRQLESLTMKVSEEIGKNTERLGSMERFMSDFLTEFNQLNHNFDLHRQGKPPTRGYRKPRKEENPT